VDTEQIQQQLRARRAAIDYKIDLLNVRGRAARKRLVPIAAVLVIVGGSFAVRRYLRSRRRMAVRRRLRVVAA
jgi:hypothetical protein